MKKYIGRRSFVKLATGSLLAIPVIVNLQSATAGNSEKLTESDPLAKALSYAENTVDVDSDSHPNHSAEQKCVGCVLYQGDDPKWGGCGAFPGKLVAGEGWCAAYAPKPS